MLVSEELIKNNRWWLAKINKSHRNCPRRFRCRYHSNKEPKQQPARISLKRGLSLQTYKMADVCPSIWHHHYSSFTTSIMLCSYEVLTVYWSKSGKFSMVAFRALFCVYYSFIHSFLSLYHSFTHSLVYLTAYPLPLPQWVRHRMRSSASSFNFQYPLFVLRSSSSCLRLLLLPRVSFHISFLE